MTDASEGAIFDEAERYIVTGELDPVTSADEGLLNDDQRRRVEALVEARDLLVSDDPSNAGGISRALVGELSRERLLTKPSGFASDLITLADYILNPTPSTPQPTVVWSGDHNPASVRMLGNVLGGVIVIPGDPTPDADRAAADFYEQNSTES